MPNYNISIYYYYYHVKTKLANNYRQEVKKKMTEHIFQGNNKTPLKEVIRELYSNENPRIVMAKIKNFYDNGTKIFLELSMGELGCAYRPILKGESLDQFMHAMNVSKLDNLKGMPAEVLALDTVNAYIAGVFPMNDNYL